MTQQPPPDAPPHTGQPTQPPQDSHAVRNGCLIAAAVVAGTIVLGVVVLGILGFALTRGSSAGPATSAPADGDAPASVTPAQRRAIDASLDTLGEEAIGPATPRGDALVFRVEDSQPFDEMVVLGITVQVQEAIREEAPGYGGDFQIDFFRTDLGKRDGMVRFDVDEDINPFDEGA